MLLIFPNNSKEKIIFNSIPGQLEIFDQKSGKKFGFLNKSLYFEIIRILWNVINFLLSLDFCNWFV